MNSTLVFEALFNSLSTSSILILIALGLAITFGVQGVINMAHGELMMVGAYAAYVVEDVNHLNLNIYWAIPASFLAAALIGYLLEIGLVRFLYGRPLDTLLATWGVGLILQQGVKLLMGPDLKALPLPGELSGAYTIGANLTLPIYRVFIVGFTVACLVVVYLGFFRTRFGLQVRAVTQNRAMASALGISTRRVDALTFAFGAGLAGLAGCIVGYWKIMPEMGMDYIVDAFMVVITGGMGQLAGTVGAGGIIGTINSFLAKFVGGQSPDMVARALVLLLVIVLIQFRPSGLFASRERA